MSDTTQYPDGPYLITWRNGDVDSIFDIRRGMAYGREGGYSTDWLLEQGGTLTPLVPSTELDAARQRIAALEAEIERLRNAPPMPQPDWSQAPDWAQWWGQDTCGSQRWYAEKPEEYEAEYLTAGLRGYALDKQQAIVPHELRLVQRPQEPQP